VAKIRMVAIDMDGTLLNDNLAVSERNRAKIQEAVDRGIYVVLATARTFKAAQHYAKALNLDIPIITYNGALVKEAAGGRVICSSKLDSETAKEIIRFGEEKGVYTKVYIDDVLYVERENEEAREFSWLHRISYRAVGKLSENIRQQPYMIVFKDEAEKIDSVREKLDQKLNLPVSYTLSTPRSLEVMNIGVSKKNALELLARRLNIRREEVLAVGNSLNDYDMLKWAGVGIAMKNSDRQLLEKWNAVSEYDNNGDGVSYILDRYLGLE